MISSTRISSPRSSPRPPPPELLLDDLLGIRDPAQDVPDIAADARGGVDHHFAFVTGKASHPGDVRRNEVLFQQNGVMEQADFRVIGPVSATIAREETALTQAAAELAADGPRDLDIVYTPLHGVGGASVVQVLETAGFATPRVVAEQEHPDADFPTVSFPNPEEPGAMDLDATV